MALIAVVWRRNRNHGVRWTDYLMLFTGIASMIAGLALIFLPDFG